MQHNAAFHQGLHCLLRLKQNSRTETHHNLCFNSQPFVDENPLNTICFHYFNTIKVAYCVPFLHNMLPLSEYYQLIVYPTYTICSHDLNTIKVADFVPCLPTQYAPVIIILPRSHIVYPAYTICSRYYNTTKVEYCLSILHNMLPLSKY